MKQIYVESYFRSGYSRFMQYINNIGNHAKRECIEKRLDIIKFFDEFGSDATRKAFYKSRSTVYLWKRKLKLSEGKLSALAPGDTTPLHKWKYTIDGQVGSNIDGLCKVNKRAVEGAHKNIFPSGFEMLLS